MLIIVRIQRVIRSPLANLVKVSTLVLRVEVGVDPQRPPRVTHDQIRSNVSGALKMNSQAIDAVIDMLKKAKLGVSNHEPLSCFSDQGQAYLSNLLWCAVKGRLMTVVVLIPISVLAYQIEAMELVENCMRRLVSLPFLRAQIGIASGTFPLTLKRAQNTASLLRLGSLPICFFRLVELSEFM
jgi:hypothetical protein